MRYEVVHKYHLIDLENVVNQSIKEGWKPIGGIAMCSSTSDGFAFSQAIIKEEEK